MSDMASHGVESVLAGQRFQPGAMICYVLMLASWMFDFQSDGAGEGLRIQIYFLLGYAAFFVLFLLSDRSSGKIAGFTPLAACTFLFLGTSVISGLLNGQELYPILRHVTTILLYLTSAYATARVVMGNSAFALRQALGALCLCFAVSTFLIVTFFGDGIDLETVRYEIQGSSSVAALGLLVLALVLGVSALEIAAGLAAAMVIFFTVTRTYLVGVAGQVMVLLPMLSGRGLFPLAIRFLALCLIAGPLFAAFGEKNFERWMERLLVSNQFDGEDPTFVTRYIEWEYMWEEFLSSYDNFFFGSGLAAETIWWLPTYFGGGDAISSSVGFGHNQHLSLLFTAGVIGGMPLLSLQFFQAWQGVRFVFVEKKNMTGPLKDIFFLGAWGSVIVFGYLSSNFLSSSFGSRGFSLWYGVGTGLLLGARSLLASLCIRKSQQS